MEDLKQIRSAHISESSPTGSNKYYSSFNKSAVKQPNKSCGWCGREAHDRAQCLAKDKDCKSCGKIGHCTTVSCKTQRKPNTYRSEKEGKNSRATGSTESRFKRSNMTSAINQIADQQSSPTASTRAGKDAGRPKGAFTKTVNLTLEEYDEYQRYLQATEFNDSLYAVYPEGEDPNVIDQVDINDAKVMAMIDTGAAANVIDELTYQSLCNKPEIVHLDKPFYGFGNPEKPLDIMGFCMATIRWKERDKRAPFIVIKGRHQALIGRRTAVALKMVTLHTCLTPANKSDLNQITGKANLSKA